MTNPMIKIHNIETGEVIEREMTSEELAQHEADKIIAIQLQEAQIAAKNEAAAAKEAAQAKLAALGLTTEDLKALGL